MVNHPEVRGLKQHIVSHDAVRHLGHSPLVLPEAPPPTLKPQLPEDLARYRAKIGLFGVTGPVSACGISADFLTDGGLRAASKRTRPERKQFSSLHLYHRCQCPIDQSKSYSHGQSHCGRRLLRAWIPRGIIHWYTRVSACGPMSHISSIWKMHYPSQTTKDLIQSWRQTSSPGSPDLSRVQMWAEVPKVYFLMQLLSCGFPSFRTHGLKKCYLLQTYWAHNFEMAYPIDTPILKGEEQEAT